eukprot:4079201-Pyramimonas_sp.AAC.1
MTSLAFHIQGPIPPKQPAPPIARTARAIWAPTDAGSTASSTRACPSFRSPAQRPAPSVYAASEAARAVATTLTDAPRPCRSRILRRRSPPCRVQGQAEHPHRPAQRPRLQSPA